MLAPTANLEHQATGPANGPTYVYVCTVYITLSKLLVIPFDIKRNEKKIDFWKPSLYKNNIYI
jgi:hypothetical protein